MANEENGFTHYLVSKEVVLGEACIIEKCNEWISLILLTNWSEAAGIPPEQTVRFGRASADSRAPAKVRFSTTDSPNPAKPTTMPISTGSIKRPRRRSSSREAEISGSFSTTR